MIFTKMQLNGNDFIFVDALNTKMLSPINVSCETCVRRFNVGADGLILINSSEIADYKMELYNSDGSKAEVCGNALLLLGKYLYESEDLKGKIKDKVDDIVVETDSGLKHISLDFNDIGEVISSTVNLGKADFDVDCSNIENKIKIKEKEYDINYLSLGNLHGVVIVDNIEDVEVSSLMNEDQRLLKIHESCNIEFIEILDKNKIKIKIFERGVGETLSCGSGAAAAAAVAVKNNLCEKDEDIRVISKGGEHKVKYTLDGDIFVTGNPKLVFNGYLKN